MADQSEQNSRVLVSIQGVPGGMLKMLDQYFRGPGKNNCVLAKDEEAQVKVIDLDGQLGRQYFDKHRASSPDIPLLLLSDQEVEVKGAVLLRKPVKPGELLIAVLKMFYYWKDRTASDAVSTANEAREERDIEIPAPVELTQTVRLSQPVLSSFQAALSLKAEPVSSFIGSAPDIDPDDPAQVERVYYRPEQYFIGYLGQAVAKVRTYQRSVEVMTTEGSLVVLSDLKSVLIDIPESKLRALSALPLHEQSLMLEFIPAERLGKLRGQADCERLESLLWKSAIWASRGRIPDGTSLDSVVALRFWPNLSRLLVFPHALRIAAYWAVQPASLLQTAQALQIPQRNVFAFYSGCSALGAVSDTGTIDAVSMRQAGSAYLHGNGRLFGRILSRIRHFT